ncbi:MAG: tetratricopeptide repeat protein [Myxococcota bacterium]
MSDAVDERWAEVEEAVELLQIGELDAAKDELLRLVEASPDNEYGHFFLGNLFYEQEDYARALKCYTTALEKKRNYVGAMIGAGQALRMLGDHERALRMGRQVLRLRKDDPDALFLVGATFFQRGDHAAAYGPLMRFLETRPEIEVALEVEGMLQVCRQHLGMPQ